MATQILYDPQVIQQFASSLYRQANSIIATHTVIGALLGLIGGGLTGFATNETAATAVGAVLLGVLGGALGLSMGRQKSFDLKLRAQTALCQVQIEANTRAAAHLRAA